MTRALWWIVDSEDEFCTSPYCMGPLRGPLFEGTRIALTDRTLYMDGSVPYLCGPVPLATCGN